MNLTQLRTFLAVVDHGSFSDAARSLDLTQPAVTQQIQALEADLGATLIDRAYRRVEPTEQGRALLPHARRILEQLEAARDAVAEAAEEVTGRLTVAASTTPGQYVLPALFGAFVKENPDVGVHLDVGDTAAVAEAVESGSADLGMTGARIRGTRSEWEEWGSDHLVMIAPPDSPLTRVDDLSLADVVEQPFVMRESGSGTRMVTEEALRAAGIDSSDLDVAIELGSSEAIVTAVEGGLGVGVVSQWMADKAVALGTVALLEVPHFPIERPFYLVVPKGSQSRAAKAFLDFIRQEA